MTHVTYRLTAENRDQLRSAIECGLYLPFQCSHVAAVCSADYARTGAAFSIIALVLSLGANFFTGYSINEPRYMFKRVAGSLHLITGECRHSAFTTVGEV